MANLRWYHYVAYFFGGAVLTNNVVILGLGVLAMGISLARALGKFHGGLG